MIEIQKSKSRIKKKRKKRCAVLTLFGIKIVIEQEKACGGHEFFCDRFFIDCVSREKMVFLVAVFKNCANVRVSNKKRN